MDPFLSAHGGPAPPPPLQVYEHHPVIGEPRRTGGQRNHALFESNKRRHGSPPTSCAPPTINAKAKLSEFASVANRTIVVLTRFLEWFPPDTSRDFWGWLAAMSFCGRQTAEECCTFARETRSICEVFGVPVPVEGNPEGAGPDNLKDPSDRSTREIRVLEWCREGIDQVSSRWGNADAIEEGVRAYMDRPRGDMGRARRCEATWWLLLNIAVMMEPVGRRYGELWDEFNQRRQRGEDQLGWHDLKVGGAGDDSSREKPHLERPRRRKEADVPRRLGSPGQGGLAYETPCPDGDDGQSQWMSVADLTVAVGGEELKNVPLASRRPTQSHERDMSEVQSAEGPSGILATGLRRISSRIFGTLKGSGKGAK